MTQRERECKTRRKTQIHREKDTDRERKRETDTERKRYPQRHRERKRDTDVRHTEKEMDKHRDTERVRERKTHTLREEERERERKTQRSRGKWSVWGMRREENKEEGGEHRGLTCLFRFLTHDPGDRCGRRKWQAPQGSAHNALLSPGTGVSACGRVCGCAYQGVCMSGVYVCVCTCVCACTRVQPACYECNIR